MPVAQSVIEYTFMYLPTYKHTQFDKQTKILFYSTRKFVFEIFRYTHTATPHHNTDTNSICMYVYE